MMNYLSKEAKADAASSVAAVGGIVLAVLASELSLPILMGAGVALVAGTAVVRVLHHRQENPIPRLRAKKYVVEPKTTAEEGDLTHIGPRT
jgi:hypothetical protein